MAHVLVVDDDPISRSIITRTLQHIDHTTEETGSVREALQCLTTNPNAYDLLTLDLLMPDMSGMDVLAWLSAMKIFMPVIVISAHLGDYTLTLPAYPYLSRIPKPFSIQDLITAAQLLLNRSAA
ncbi:MAG: response regulator [Anaerolineae bacterium]|nr:response regulator [Anaerolineae bacterium]